MFADIGYANIFQQAGLMNETSTRFNSIATVSGGSWFSTQLFYSHEFYKRSALAASPDDIEEFVLEWMETYYNISSNVSDEVQEECSQAEKEELLDVCELLHEFNYDWAYFIEQMLKAASTNYGDPTFVEKLVNPQSRIEPLQNTSLIIQAALMPVSRLRFNDSGKLSSTAVYLGYDVDGNPSNADLFTGALPLSWVVETAKSYFWYGTDDIVQDNDSELYTYVEEVPVEFSYADWDPFYLYPGTDGNITRSSTEIIEGLPTYNKGSSIPTKVGTLRTPFGGNIPTVVQVASISSAAGGPYSPANPSVYAQTFSMGNYAIEEETMALMWRILSGVAIGLVTAAIIASVPMWLCKGKDNNKQLLCYFSSFGACIGIIAGTCAGIFIGFGSILVPDVYDKSVKTVYENPNFDAFAVCSQWPNSCGPKDAMLIDGWLVDNPAVVSNVGHYQQYMSNNETLKIIITDTDQKWNTWARAQFLQYFSTYFNSDVAPGDFLWGPDYYAPYRSPQIFEEYLDNDGIDALIEPISNSNMTTAILSGITIDNPAFNVTAGTSVEILLLNLNEDITTLVIGKKNIEKYTQPLADMAKHVASSEVLVQRVRDFVG